MLTFQEIHAYNNLASEGKAKPLVCPLNPDDGNLTSICDENENVVLVCFICNTKVKPGINMIESIRKVLY